MTGRAGAEGDVGDLHRAQAGIPAAGRAHLGAGPRLGRRSRARADLLRGGPDLGDPRGRPNRARRRPCPAAASRHRGRLLIQSFVFPFPLPTEIYLVLVLLPQV